jgi:transcriptional regulator with XRE-family HTH domain
VAEGSPTVRRRELGALLRRLREEKGMSVKQVTQHLLCSPSKVSRIETGQRGVTFRDVRDLCDLYGVTDQAERDRLMNLAREAREPGWWQSYDLSDTYSTYIGYEAEAVYVKAYNSSVVPGLLQTADYARALFEEPLPQGSVITELTAEAKNQRLEVRLRRQALLDEMGSIRSFRTVLDEAVLHRIVGSPVVMREQLERMIAASQARKVSVQIAPYAAGAHPALNSTFDILEFSGDFPGVVYVEGVTDHMYLEPSDDFEKYRQVFGRMSKIAMTEDQSIELISKVWESYSSFLRLQIRDK